LFSNTRNICSSVNVTCHVPRPYKATVTVGVFEGRRDSVFVLDGISRISSSPTFTMNFQTLY
jgi:hypothetical protein